MDAQARKRIVCTCVSLFLIPALLAACGGTNAAPTYYLPPTPATSPVPPALVQATTLALASGPTPTTACTNSLLFLQDLTIPDNSVVAPGSNLDKQWQVQNNGSCNWDSRYRLRFIGGDTLGAPREQALFPARSGTQLVIRMLFIAPNAPGNYFSEWRAYDPQDASFGDTFFIKITVSP
jgi:Ig-like domain from next to BRCA1 gene